MLVQIWRHITGYLCCCCLLLLLITNLATLQSQSTKTMAHAAMRINAALLELRKVAAAANGIGGSAHAADCVRALWASVHEQVSKAVAAKGVTYAGGQRSQSYIYLPAQSSYKLHAQHNLP